MSEIIPEKQSQINCEIVLENNKMNSSKHVDQKNEFESFKDLK